MGAALVAAGKRDDPIDPGFAPNSGHATDPRAGTHDAVARFVVLEGGDATGKSTQVSCSWRGWSGGARGRHHVRAGRDPARARLRSLLLDESGPIDPIAEALLMAADRAEHVAEVVRPALSAVPGS